MIKYDPETGKPVFEEQRVTAWDVLRCFLVGAFVAMAVMYLAHYAWGYEPPRPIPLEPGTWHAKMADKYPLFRSTRNEVLMGAAQMHADYMAFFREQGHQLWERRWMRLANQLGQGQYAEICAQSWPWMRDADDNRLWADAFWSWKHSRGHWAVACRKHDAIGWGRARGKNGTHYTAVITFDKSKWRYKR